MLLKSLAGFYEINVACSVLQVLLVLIILVFKNNNIAKGFIESGGIAKAFEKAEEHGRMEFFT
jgi:hypothetical protein